MKQLKLIIACVMLTCFALFPVLATADVDDLDVTMEVMDNAEDVNNGIEMLGPESDDGQHDFDETDSDEGRDEDRDDEDDRRDEDDDDFDDDDDFESDEDGEHSEEESDFDEGDDIETDEADDDMEDDVA